MLEPTQVLLFTVVTVLTIVMVLIGWQIFQILSEIKKMLEKFNQVVSGAVTITTDVGKSVKNISGFSEGFKAAFSLLKHFKKKDRENE